MKHPFHRLVSGLLAIALFTGLAPRLAAANGHLDAIFNHNIVDAPSGPDGRVLALAVAQDDSVLIAGEFLHVRNQLSPAIARLKPDGSPDPTFHSQFSPYDHPSMIAIAVTPDGKFVIAGPRLVSRLLDDGTPDPSFKASNGAVPLDPSCVAVDADGRVLVGSSDPNPRALVRLLADGPLDPTFNPGYSAAVRSVIPLPGGGVMVAGMGGLVRLLESGALDPAFTSTTDGPVYAMDRIADGRIVISGTFRLVGSAPRAGIARLLADGTVDPNFEPTPFANYPVEHVLAMPDGTAVFSGSFGTTGETVGTKPIRLGNDGQEDGDFPALSWQPDSTVLAMGRQSTGAIVCGGDFARWGFVPRTRLARLNPDGFPRPGFISIGLEKGDDFRVMEGTLPIRRILRRIGGTDGAVSVWVGDRPSSIYYAAAATNGVDYTFVPRRVEFADGQSKATVEIPIIDDDIAKPERIFELFQSEPAGGADLTTPGVSVVMIDDNDAAAALANPVQVVSELSGADQIELRRIGDSRIPFAVEVEFIPGTARPGIDYEPISTRVYFGAGIDWASASVRIPDNGVTDGSRKFGVRLHEVNGTNHIVQPSEGVVTIHDNESPGGIDPSFPPLSADVEYAAFHALPDGSAIAIAWGSRLVKLLPTFREDPAFHAAIRNLSFASNYSGLAVGVWDDGRIIVLEPKKPPFSDPAPMVRLLADGSRDLAFPTNIVVSARNTSFHPQPDGTFYVAADSIAIGKTTRGGLAHFGADGTLDAKFDPRVPGSVNVVAVGPDGRVYIAGALWENSKESYVARLLTNGLTDKSFQASGKALAPAVPTGYSFVHAMLLAPDGSLYLGGFFRKFGDANVAPLVRLRPDGGLDPSFVASGLSGFLFDSQRIAGLALQSDGHLLVSGAFVHTVGDAPGVFQKTRLIRLLADGAIDPNFNADIDGGFLDSIGRADLERPLAMTIVGDGELLINGSFYGIGGVNWPSIARLYLDPPGIPARAPVLSGSFHLADGTVRLRLANPVAGKFALEGSDTLDSWQTLSTHDLAPDVLELTDTPPPGTSARFYRLRSLP